MSDTNTPPATPEPGTDEYNQMMADRADAGGFTAPGIPPKEEAPANATADVKPTVPTRPDHIPEKFWDAAKGEVNVEAMAKSYAELEKAKAAPPVTPPSTEAAPAPATTLDTAMAQAAAEYANGGKLSEASYAALQAAGISKTYADAYIEGLQAKSELTTAKVHGEAGGKEAYDQMIGWARSSLTPEQAAQFDAGIQSGDMSSVVGAVRNLKALYEAANGKAPASRLAPADAGLGSPAGAHFRSAAELTKAMSDPRYKVDPAYRAEVAQKVASSSKLGVNLSIFGV